MIAINRFYLDTVRDAGGNIIAQVMERPRPFADGVCIERYTYEWRAVKRIQDLQKEAIVRDEETVFDPRFCCHDSWKSIYKEDDT